MAFDKIKGHFLRFMGKTPHEISDGHGGMTTGIPTKYFTEHPKKMGSLPNLLPTPPNATLRAKEIRKASPRNMKGECHERPRIYSTPDTHPLDRPLRIAHHPGRVGKTT